MRIGYFTSALSYKNPLTNEKIGKIVLGGTEAVAYHLARNIAKKGYRTTIFTTSIDSKDSVERYGNIEIFRYGKAFTIGSAGMSFKLLYKPLKHEVDIVHAHAGNPPAPIAAYWYAKKNKKPFIITYHGDGQWNWGGVIRRTSVYFYNKYLLDRILSYADVIISPSKYYIDESRVLAKYRDKIVVIPNGVNIAEFDISYSKEECREKLDLSIDDKIILYLSGLVLPKGPDVLLNALPKIIKGVSNAKLVFVGKGGMREELVMVSKKLGVKKNIKFAGFVGDVSKKALYYQSADVFVFPSTGPEMFGIVNLEAMACGVPIVASKIGGVPDVVKDGENGLLVQPRDSESLADAIIYLLENEDVREKMGKRGKEMAKDYSWERNAEETEKVYRRLI